MKKSSQRRSLKWPCAVDCIEIQLSWLGWNHCELHHPANLPWPYNGRYGCFSLWVLTRSWLDSQGLATTRGCWKNFTAMKPPFSLWLHCGKTFSTPPSTNVSHDANQMQVQIRLLSMAWQWGRLIALHVLRKKVSNCNKLSKLSGWKGQKFISTLFLSKGERTFLISLSSLKNQFVEWGIPDTKWGTQKVDSEVKTFRRLRHRQLATGDHQFYCSYRNIRPILASTSAGAQNHFHEKCTPKSQRASFWVSAYTPTTVGRCQSSLLTFSSCATAVGQGQAEYPVINALSRKKNQPTTGQLFCSFSCLSACSRAHRCSDTTRSVGHLKRKETDADNRLARNEEDDKKFYFIPWCKKPM